MQHGQKLRIFPAYMHYHKNCVQISFCFQKKLWYPSLYSNNEILLKNAYERLNCWKKVWEYIFTVERMISKKKVDTQSVQMTNFCYMSFFFLQKTNRFKKVTFYWTSSLRCFFTKLRSFSTKLSCSKLLLKFSCEESKILKAISKRKT